MSAAISLQKAGWEPVIVERAPGRRRGGYFVGFFPEGKKAAKALGVFDKFHFRTPKGTETWDIRPNGDRLWSPGFLDQPADEEQGGIEGALRGDLEEGLWQVAKDICTVRFNTVPCAIDERGDVVNVRLRDIANGAETTESFNLVIGADGVRSTVRDIVFGPREKFIKPVNSMICAFEMDAPIPTLEARDGIMICEVDRALWVFPLSDKPPTVLLTWRVDDDDSQFTRRPIDVVREVYGDSPHKRMLGAIFDQLERKGEGEYLYDSVNKVQMDRWHKGRVVMLGDAAWCLTLYSGMGATSAMKGAVELADAIAASPGDILRALRDWEAGMRPFIRKHRIITMMKAEVFVPSSRLRSRLRHQLMRMGTRSLLKRRRNEACSIMSSEAA
ncbi:FAD-dependent monooxygenase [Novosphingobium malaysiense]|nr:FAD-dependent monooxygenase [Novosphingobium malaysiense]